MPSTSWTTIRATVILCVALAMLICLVECQDGGGYFLKASKSVPRIGKRSKGGSGGGNGNSHNDEFEKFFLKASKSVPRIGRRGSPSEGVLTAPQSDFNKFGTWSDLSELYEYNPELFAYPQFISKFEDYDNMMGDDPHTNWDKGRFKRTNLPPNYNNDNNKEFLELRFQPEHM